MLECLLSPVADVARCTPWPAMGHMPTFQPAAGIRNTRWSDGEKLHHAKNELTDLFMDKP
jgi:hypothetical protein